MYYYLLQQTWYACLQSGVQRCEILDIALGFSKAMEDAEREQRSYGDRFWGYDNEIDNCNKERADMNYEEKRSRIQELHHAAMANHIKWEREIKEEMYSESFVRSLEQVQERRRYLKTVFSTERSQNIIDYKWSSRLKVRPLTDADVVTSSRRSKMIPKYNLKLREVRPSRSQTPMTGQLLKQAISLQERPPFDVSLRGGQQKFRPYKADNSSTAPSLEDAELFDVNGSVTSQMSLNQKGIVDTCTQRSTIRHTNVWDGHPEFKWDQEIMLKKSFNALCEAAASDPVSTSSAHVLCLSDYEHLGILIARLPDVQKMLRFTVFGSWVKRKKWKLFNPSCIRTDQFPSKLSLTLVDWLTIARDNASKERAVESQFIRADDEHRSSITLPCNKWCERRERLSKIARTVVVGSMVWSLHGRGVTWLPAIVEALHVRAPSSTKESRSDSFTYDLSYLTTQEAFALASDLQTSVHQATKLSAMTLLDDLHENVPFGRNQNQREQAVYPCQRVVNVTKSRCNNSPSPEKVLIGYVYDTYYASSDTSNDHTDLSEGEEDYVNHKTQLETLFEAIENTHMGQSSEALSCVSGRIEGSSLPPTNLYHRRGSQARGILDGRIFKGFLTELLAFRGRIPTHDTEKLLTPLLSSSCRSHATRFMRRDEWIETCLASMDICRFNSY